MVSFTVRVKQDELNSITFGRVISARQIFFEHRRLLFIVLVFRTCIGSFV